MNDNLSARSRATEPRPVSAAVTRSRVARTGRNDGFERRAESPASARANACNIRRWSAEDSPKASVRAARARRQNSGVGATSSVPAGERGLGEQQPIAQGVAGFGVKSADGEKARAVDEEATLAETILECGERRDWRPPATRPR